MIINKKPCEIKRSSNCRVEFIPSKDIFWDNWGTMTKVFQAGHKYYGNAVIENGNVVHMDATAPYHNASDYFHKNEIAEMDISVVSISSFNN